MSANKELYALCERIVAELMSQRGWHLLHKDDFVHIVFERAKAEGKQKASSITRIAVNEYCKVLHRACSPQSDSEDHHQAYEELSHYLYKIAYNRRRDRPEDAEKATQKALIDTYQALMNNKCRKPGAFLSFSVWKLRAAFKKVDRDQKKEKNIIPFEELFPYDDQGGDSDMEWESRLKDESSLSPEEEIERHEEETERQLLARAIIVELERKFQIHPRATNQLEAVIMKHASGYDNQEIARALGVASPEAVYSLISRGKKKLADNIELEELFAQLFLRVFRGWIVPSAR